MWNVHPGIFATNSSKTSLPSTLRYLFATSQERARVIGELTARNPRMADLLTELEAGADLLRLGFELGLLDQSSQW